MQACDTHTSTLYSSRKSAANKNSICRDVQLRSFRSFFNWLRQTQPLHTMLVRTTRCGETKEFGRVVSRQSKGGCPPLAGQRSFRASLPTLQGPGCTPGAVNVSLLCTSILRHWQWPFLFNMRQVSMFSRCGYRVLWEEPRRRLARRPPSDHTKAIFLIDFHSGQRPPE